MTLSVFGPRTRPVLEGISQSKGKPPLIYFSTSSFSTNYFFIAHLFYLSQIYKIQKSSFIIVFNDLGRDNEPQPRFMVPSDTSVRISEVYSLMNWLGVPPGDIKIRTASESWRRYLLMNEDAPSKFLQGILLLNPETASMPVENAALEFLHKANTYGLSDIVQKYIDLLISSNYSKIFPEDFDDSVDIHVTSFFSYSLLQKIKANFVHQKSESAYIPPIYSLPKLPSFGHNPAIFPEHIAPKIGMTLTEIRNSIKLYSLNKEFTRLIFENFLNHAAKEFVHFDGKRRAVLPYPPSLSGLTLRQQHIILAENLYNFLQQAKQSLDSKELQLSITLNGECNTSRILGLLKSPLALDILKLVNGKNKVCDIARELKKHQPNVSKTISQLKAQGLVRTNSSNRPVRTFSRIEILF